MTTCVFLRIGGGLVALALWTGLAVRPAVAADCGGPVRCQCGDRVVQSTTLAEDLGVCAGVGLELVSGVVLDCAGHTITGSDAPGAWYGIHLDETEKATVRNCRVTKFRRGIRLRGGSKNVITGNESFENRYGIDIAVASNANRLRYNLVRDNRDEGIHIGTDSDLNQILDNELHDNKRENLYLLHSDRNRVLRNVLHHSDAAAIYVKHSSGNVFRDNEVRDRPILLRGDSRRNVFRNNDLKGDGYILEAYEEPEGWSAPRSNRFFSDLIRKTDWCFRFLGASDNHAKGLETDGRCAPITTETVGGLEATGNTVEMAPDN